MTIEEVFNSEEFKQNVEDKLKSIYKSKQERPKAPIGKVYKRDWIDKLVAEGNYSAEYFIDKVQLIWEGRANKFSNELRSALNGVCQGALLKAVLFYTEQEKQLQK